MSSNTASIILQNRGITWVNGDPLSNVFYGIHMSAFSEKSAREFNL